MQLFVDLTKTDPKSEREDKLVKSNIYAESPEGVRKILLNHIVLNKSWTKCNNLTIVLPHCQSGDWDEMDSRGGGSSG